MISGSRNLPAACTHAQHSAATKLSLSPAQRWLSVFSAGSSQNRLAGVLVWLSLGPDWPVLTPPGKTAPHAVGLPTFIRRPPFSRRAGLGSRQSWQGHRDVKSIAPQIFGAVRKDITFTVSSRHIGVSWRRKQQHCGLSIAGSYVQLKCTVLCLCLPVSAQI